MTYDLCTDPACPWAKASPAGVDHNISDHAQLAEAGEDSAAGGYSPRVFSGDTISGLERLVE